VPGSASQSGKSAVVTGASSGIGRAIAERLGAEGAHVVLCGRTESAMKESAKRIEAAGGGATIVTGDLRDDGVVQGLIDTAVAVTGHLDVMVNNAGIADFKPILEGSIESWRSMYETNVIALLVGCQAAVRAMRATGQPGHIVNISSVAAQNPASGVYGSTKHAVSVLTSTLRLELIEDPIKVTTILPGVIATNMARSLDPSILATIAGLSGLNVELVPGERISDDVLEAAQLALSEFTAKPEDVANAVLFAVNEPAGVHIAEIVVRPNKDMAIF
jgi:NADP-dependent 3-hydroxy acid dehydrogenase YdfG